MSFWVNFCCYSFAITIVLLILYINISSFNHSSEKLRREDELRKEITDEQYLIVEQLIKEHPTLKPIVSNSMLDDEISVSEFEHIKDMKFKSKLK
jgi:hypoxanthine-guanine phosphoribosyltransferase